MMKPKTVKTWLFSTHYSDSFCRGPPPRMSWVPSNIRTPLPPIRLNSAHIYGDLETETTVHTATGF